MICYQPLPSAGIHIDCSCSQIRDKGGNAAYMVRQLYQKYLLPFEDNRSKRDSSASVGQSKPGAAKVSTYDRIVAAANGKEDIEVLGAVAALMDAPAAPEGRAPLVKRQKLDSAEVCSLQIKISSNMPFKRPMRRARILASNRGHLLTWTPGQYFDVRYARLETKMQLNKHA